MTLEEINSERKSLNDQLKSLKTQRDAKALALQQRNEMFNSDKFLASLYKVDPAAASFFADKQVKDRQIDINANKLYSGTYTPEQKSIIDAKQQNRIRMGEILSTINTLKTKGATETEIEQWQSQYDSLVANDKRLNSLLANLQTPGYTSTEVAQTPPNNNGGEKRLVMSPDENGDEYYKFRNSLLHVEYTVNNIPDVASIVLAASKWIGSDGVSTNYSLSEQNARSIKDEIEKDTQRRSEEKQNKLERAAKEEQLRQDKYDNWLKNNLPNVSSQSADISSTRDKIVLAIEMAKKNPQGGAYISLKNALKDAIGKSDFAGLTGFTGVEGIKAKINEMFNNSSLTEEQAKEIIESIINGFNAGVDYHNDRIKNAKSDNKDFVNIAYKAYKVDRVPMPNFINLPTPPPSSNNNAGGNTKITIIGWGKK